MCVMCIMLTAAQLSPVYPAVYEQVQPLTKAVQIPPFDTDGARSSPFIL